MIKTIEFETELTDSHTLSIPPEIAAALPPKGKVTIVVFVDMDPEDSLWRKAAYEQFLSDARTKTPSMTNTVELGDVYVCVFPFTSGQGAKARPVLVLMDLGPDCLVCRINLCSPPRFPRPTGDLVARSRFGEAFNNQAVTSGHGGKASPPGPDRRINPR
jgi:hypothetical protein